MYVIAVPTPFKDSQDDIPEPDLKFIENAITSISGCLKKGDLIILESTSPVGTSEYIAKYISSLRPDLSVPYNFNDDSDINIAYCPERVMPGNMLEELIKNDRVIGGLSHKCSQKALAFYKLFVEGQCHLTDSKTAEMVKLTENACRDVEIAFANELSILCSNLKIDVNELIGLANKHPRINILNPGCGVGGHCIAVDPWFIINRDKQDAVLLHAARKRNLYKEEWVSQKILKLSKELDSKKRIVLLGAAYKPNIEDLRESPALRIANYILDKANKDVALVEPNILSKEINNLKNISLKDLDSKTDIIFKLVNHKEFFNLNSELDVISYDGM